MVDDRWAQVRLAALACLTLGLAPFTPPHVVDKLRRVAAGAHDMAPVDWFDLVLHGAPWVWLVVALAAAWRAGNEATDTDADGA